MKTNQHCLGYTMQGAMWGKDTMDDGFYSLNQNITRALVARDHLGYYPKTAPWEKNLCDFGYYSINNSITRALKNLSGNS
jgi:hypothetical protein